MREEHTRVHVCVGVLHLALAGGSDGKCENVLIWCVAVPTILTVSVPP